MIIDSHQHVILPTEKQLALMNEAGVDKTILFSTLVHPEQSKDLESFEREMSILSEILAGQRNPSDARRSAIKEQVSVIENNSSKFLGFGSVPLGLSQEDTATWIIENVVANKFCGLGEFTIAPGQVPMLEKIFLASMDFGNLPIWIHTFLPMGSDDIRATNQLSMKYPHVPVILGHLGGTNWLEAIKMAKDNPFLYLDLSATFSTIAPAMAIKEMPQRTLFSSDAPYGDPLVVRQMIERITPDKHIRELVLGGTIAELLKL